MSIDPAKLTFQADGVAYLVPCLDLTLYWAGSPFEHHDGIVAFYREALNLVGRELKFFRTETMTAARPLKKGTLDLVPFWFQGTSTRRDIYMLYLESGARADEPSDRAFALNATLAMGFVRLILPISFIEQSTSAFLELATRVSGALRYDSGYGGYSVNFNHLSRYNRQALQAMHSLASRYPGLDMAHPFVTQFAVTKGIKCVNWLTYLNVAHVEQLGGIARMAAASRRLILHPSSNGVMVQAGRLPQLGDVNRRDTVPDYHDAGRLVAPIRFRDHPAIFGQGGVGDKEATEAWLSRFDT